MSANAPAPQGGGGDFADIEGAPPPGGGAPAAEVIGGVAGAVENGVPFVGPDGMLAQGPINPDRFTPGSTGHTYYEGQQYDILKGLTTEDRTRLQQQLQAVGLISNPMFGEIDDVTITGMSKLLTMSNRAGTSWDATLNRLATNPNLQGAGEDEAEFDAPTYLAPDYATLAQRVKGMFRDVLNRDPDQAEMAQLTAELQGWHKGAFDAEVSAQRQDFDNRVAEGEQSGGTVQQVDPLSRFKETFEKRYANELDFVEDKAEAQESRAAVEQTTGTLSAMSTGGA